MPAVRPLTPIAIRTLLEQKGYQLIGADDFNWAFQLGPQDEPVFVPIKVALVPIEVAFHIAKKVGFNDYFGAIADADAEPFSEEASGDSPKL